VTSDYLSDLSNGVVGLWSVVVCLLSLPCPLSPKLSQIEL